MDVQDEKGGDGERAGAILRKDVNLHMATDKNSLKTMRAYTWKLKTKKESVMVLIARAIKI